MLISIRHVTRYTLRRAGALQHPEPAADAALVRGPARRRAGASRCRASSTPLSFRDGFGNIVHLVDDQRARTTSIAIDGRAARSRRRTTAGVVARPRRGAPPRVFLRETPKTAPDEPSASWRPVRRRQGSARPAARADAAPSRDRGRLRDRRDGRAHQRRRGARPTARASARTMRTSSSRRRACSASRRATSTAISSAGDAARPRRPIMPGPRPGSRASAGSASTPPTASARPSATCAWPAASMPAPPRRSAARGGAATNEALDVWVEVQQQERPAAVTLATAPGD